MKLTSKAFQNGEKIPSRYTCDGIEISPPLEIEEAPPRAVSFVLIVDDPDVPEYVRLDRMWVHWVVIDMPADTRHILENQQPPGIPGKNTRGDLGYQGPCPPDREHRYFFKLYALDKKLALPKGASKIEVEKAMAGHILERAELMGKYERKRHSAGCC